MFQITTRLEINVSNASTYNADLRGLATFVIKNRIPAVVVSPEFLEPVLFEKGKKLANFKVICLVGFPDGKGFALEKFRDLPQQSMMADGFEVMLTPGRSDKECLNELRAVTQFIRQFGLKELRWAFSFRTVNYDRYEHFLPHILKWPASYVRTDGNLLVPNLSFEDHLLDVEFIRSVIGTPIKISGNVDLGMIESLKKRVARFDVTLDQARDIIREYKNNEDFQLAVAAAHGDEDEDEE